MVMTRRRDTTVDTIPRRVHLVGIGGAHMSAIARILVARGHVVSGSDLRASNTTRDLEALGIRVFIGHAAANLGDAQLVATTIAATGDNVELAEARRRGVAVLTRAQMVARLIAGRTTLAVSGSHGKTTTTALAVVALRAAGIDPTFLVGGDVVGLGSNAGSGVDLYAVIEADEYGHAFLEYEPHIAIITNLEPDHLDYFGSYDALRDAFRAYMGRVRPGGLIIAGAESLDLLALVARTSTAGELRAPAETYALLNGVSADWEAADVRVEPAGGQSFTALHDGEPYGRFAIALPGRHNVANALAVVAATAALGLDREAVARGLASAGGAKRRFERVGEAAGIAVYDDYAHHPTEVRATLAAARQRFGQARIVICFQPHTEARTRYLFDEFVACFAEADALYVLETYAARDTKFEGTPARTLAEAIARPSARYVATHEEARDTLARELLTGDTLFTMGAGDVDRLGPMLLDALRGKGEQGKG